MPSVNEIGGSESYHLMEFEKLHGNEKKITCAAQCTWRPPQEDIYKINSDRSFDPTKRSGGWGFLTRNNNGEVLAACAGNISYASSSLQTEAIAAYKGVLQAAQLGMSQIVLEMDATILVVAVKSSSVDRSSIDALVFKIRDVMQSEFSSCTVSLCNRNCNKVADCLALHGAYVLESGSDMLMSQVPSYVMDLVKGDLPVSDV